MPVDGVSAQSSDFIRRINPKLGSSNLGIDDFFTLLSAQLQNQNMFEPTGDTEFIAQMAQFSTLQQMKDLAASFQNTYAVSLIGKNVKVNDVDNNGYATVISGKVDKIIMKDGKSQLSINGIYYDTTAVTEVLSE